MVIRIRLQALLAAAFCLLALSGAAVARRMSAPASAGEGSAGARVPILMYHEVREQGLGKDVIAPWELEADLRWLKENGYVSLTMTELIDGVTRGMRLPDKPVILSFDDGYLNNYVYVLPLLERYDMTIVLSVLGKNSDDFTETPDSSLIYSHVTWAQLREMADSGRVEVQNHTYDLHGIRASRTGSAQAKGESFEEYERVLTEDLTRLQRKLEAELGTAPNTFTIPYGKYNDNTIAIVKKLGFRAVLTCDYGVNVLNGDPEVLFSLKRICRSHGKPASRLLAEAYKALPQTP